MNRLGTVFQEQKEKNTEFKRQNALKFTYGSIIPKPQYAITKDLVDTYTKYTMINANDIVINCLNLNYDFVSQRVAIAKCDGIITSAYIVLRARNEQVNPMYYCYYLKSMDAQKMFNGMGTGIRLTLAYNELRNIPLPIPPRAEQDQIVRFLDWKVSEINKLIQMKNAEIQQLEELKLSKVNHFVTKGLHNVLLKDSDVDWMGQIPLNWDVDTIKQHFSIQKRIAGQEGYDVLSITQQGLKVKNTKLNEGQLAQSYANYQLVYPGDFAMNLMDLLTGYVDLSDKFGVTSPDYRVFTAIDSEQCYSPYYLRIFQIGYKRHVFYKFGKGAANSGWWRLSRRDFLDYLIPVPPFKEQVEIAKACDNVISTIDKAIRSLNSEIPKLHELKARIISDVVTGQIDVRNVTIPEYEHIDDTATEGEEDAQEAD